MKILIASLVLVCVVYSVQGMYIHESACTAAKDLVLCLPAGRTNCDDMEDGVVSVYYLLTTCIIVVIIFSVLEAKCLLWNCKQILH